MSQEAGKKEISSKSVPSRSSVLIGFMGSGKSTCGKIAAKRAGISFLDTDKEIEKQAGKSISAIFKDEGEEAFRILETETLKRLAGRKGRCIYSVGGGTPLREENRKLLKKLGKVIYLKASPEAVLERLKGNTTRPLLQGDNPEKKVRELMAERQEIYEAAADITIDTDPYSPREIASMLI